MVKNTFNTLKFFTKCKDKSNNCQQFNGSNFCSRRQNSRQRAKKKWAQKVTLNISIKLLQREKEKIESPTYATRMALNQPLRTKLLKL
jgi:hypothetical protein